MAAVIQNKCTERQKKIEDSFLMVVYNDFK